jgi:hypothetical protein
VIFVGVPYIWFLYEKPTCFDGKQNGNERGIDCSGSCARLCPADYVEPKLLWTSSMRVVPGVYNALAYVQNINQGVESIVPYIFKFYDSRGVMIGERKGSAYVPPGQRFVVFQGGIQFDQAIPVKTTFEWSGVSAWRKGVPLTKIKTADTSIDQAVPPKAEIKIENVSIDETFSNIDAFIVLYDAEGNRVAFSKTVIDRIDPEEKKLLYFTWPEAFPSEAVKSEMIFIPRITR